MEGDLAGAHGPPPNIDGMTSLKVDNLNFKTTCQDIQPLFEKYGEVGDIYIPRDRFTKESRGFAFVRYHSRRAAEEAMDRLDGYRFDGREMRVQLARFGRPSRPPPRWGSGRRGSYGRSRRSRSRSRSRDRDRSHRHRRSYSRSTSRSRSRSRSPRPSRGRHNRRSFSHSMSRSPPRDKYSPSPVRYSKNHRGRSSSYSRSRSGSPSRSPRGRY